MRALVVYESVYGNTHAIAEAIGRGLAEQLEVVAVVPVTDAGPDGVTVADLLVVGGPTHVHGMASERTRAMALKAETDDDVHLEPHPAGPGLRDWFEELPGGFDRRAAAFDTRLDHPSLLTGRASRAIARRLKHLGYDLVARPESFLVTDENRLGPGEEELAVDWGRTLADRVVPASR